jgi:hypothetical protein
MAHKDHPLPHYRFVDGGKIVVRRSEADAWMERWRNVGRRDLLLDRALERIRQGRPSGTGSGSHSKRVSEAWARKKAAMQASGQWEAFCAKRSQITRDAAVRRRAKRTPP